MRKSLPTGVRPLSKSERKRLTRENRRALFPSIALDRYEATVVDAEAKGRPQLEQRRDASEAKA